MHFGHKSSRCRETGAYVDILNLVDEFRLGPAGCVHLCTLCCCDIYAPPDLTVFFSGHTVQLVHVWEDLCKVHSGRP